MSTAHTRLVALLGHPVSHTRSPAMMTAAFASLGLDAAYLAFDVEPANLSRAFDGLRTLGALGANLTVPHKREALSLCTTLDDESRAIGAVNTVRFTRDGIEGFNTDAHGAAQALIDGAVVLEGARVVLFGVGGAARAVAVGVARRGASMVIAVGRDVHRAGELALAVKQAVPGCETHGLAWSDTDGIGAAVAMADVLVQCTPLGMSGVGDGTPDHVQLLAFLTLARAGAAAMDLVYEPRETLWLTAARARGLLPVDGLGMLAHQGAAAIGHWFRVEGDPRTLRRILDGGTP